MTPLQIFVTVDLILLCLLVALIYTFWRCYEPRCPGCRRPIPWGLWWRVVVRGERWHCPCGYRRPRTGGW